MKDADRRRLMILRSVRVYDPALTGGDAGSEILRLIHRKELA